MGNKRQKLLDSMANSTANIKFKDLVWLCDQEFGDGTQRGSHKRWTTGLTDLPGINLQPSGADAKPYQVEQVRKVFRAIDKAKKQAPAPTKK